MNLEALRPAPNKASIPSRRKTGSPCGRVKKTLPISIATPFLAQRCNSKPAMLPSFFTPGQLRKWALQTEVRRSCRFCCCRDSGTRAEAVSPALLPYTVLLRTRYTHSSDP